MTLCYIVDVFVINDQLVPPFAKVKNRIKVNRICKHLANFETPIPPTLRADVINVWSLMKHLHEIVALNILHNVEFKHYTYWNSRDILVAIHIITSLDKVLLLLLLLLSSLLLLLLLSSSIYYFHHYNFIYSRIIRIIKNMYIYNSQITNKDNKIREK